MNGSGEVHGVLAGVAREQGRALVERVAASIAHAVAGPLNVLELRLAKLRRAAGDGTDVEQALRAVDEQTRRLIDLVSRPRIRARAERPRAESCDLREVVEPILSLLVTNAEARNVALHFQVESTTVIVPLPTIRMIVHDVVSYAVGRSSAGSEVRIHAKRRTAARGPTQLYCIEFLVRFSNPVKLSDPQVLEPWFSEDSGELADRILLARSCGAVRDHGGWFDADAGSECINMLWPLGPVPTDSDTPNR
jgi:signal transduction histidine kinase